MFYHLLNKEYRLSFLLLIGFGLFLFKIDVISEWIISTYSGIDFIYEEPAHLKLVYLLLLVVLIGLTSAVNKNEALDSDLKKKNYLKWILMLISFFLIGEIIHVWMISNIILNRESIMEIEQNVWLYYIADYLLLIGFSLGGFLFIRPLIHQN